MARDQKDSYTLDLLDWTPPKITVAFEAQEVRAATLAATFSRAISKSLKDCGLERDVVAKSMSDYLGEEVSKHMLDSYASQSRTDHNISLVRTVALIHVTKDVRLLGTLAQMFGHAVIPAKYLAAVEEAMLEDKIERMKNKKAACRLKWRGA